MNTFEPKASRPASAAPQGLFARLGETLRWQAGRLLNNGRNDGPPDLDELWRDFNRKLSGMFGGGKRPGNEGNGGSNGGGNNFQPDMKSAGIGAGLIVGVVALAWMGSGFFIVQEGQQAVVTSFGKYSKTVGAGFQWRLPYPFQGHETVAVTQLRSVEIGRSGVVAATGLRDSSMLTQDENIVDIRFSVQYLLKDARDFMFENSGPEAAVVQAAESAVREIVGKSNMDSVLYEQRDAIAAELAKSVQAQLDRLKAGILIKNVNVQQVQAPEQVQAAFDDALKATADRERIKNEAEAHANQVIPQAQGRAARLRQEAEAYKSRVISMAEGDAQRFKSVLAEYQKAPAVTRDRLYIDTMRDVYANVSKVMVDSRNGSNLLYLPLDKLLQQGSTVTASPPTPAAVQPDPVSVPLSSDVRSRDGLRSRDRDGR
ncbi:FtsH protease activity modulator HflK [Pelomonas sp. SE-A7]|uniref:FtsH protease activity modulator HflK n=1 Tax=Pelomonas sp. SE-A7 TaxID=3054953 RepID=UPI00259CD093|nr:FtsH protease activity modulator HflK [Pelomonas sp. SE-A7]MDM4767383.1 FtsH protease activity modulator HflK [Pelomonas sp. SE-A7]